MEVVAHGPTQPVSLTEVGGTSVFETFLLRIQFTNSVAPCYFQHPMIPAGTKLGVYALREPLGAGYGRGLSRL